MTESKPETLVFRRTPEGIEITLHRPPLWRRSKRRLVKFCLITGVVTLFAAAPPIALALYGESPSVTVVFPLVYFFAGLGAVASEINWDREVGVLTLGQGRLRILPDPQARPKEWKIEDLAAIRACPVKLDWELQIELRNGQVFRAFKGRSGAELQFSAGLLQADLAAAPRTS